MEFIMLGSQKKNTAESLVKTYTDIYVNTQQLLLNTTLFYRWRRVSAAHTAIFRPAYSRTGPFMCAQYGIPHCLHIKYM